MSYAQFIADDGEAYGSFEVFYAVESTLANNGDDEPKESGWYWWACFPGCLPDGDPCGPFATEQEAIDDAKENR